MAKKDDTLDAWRYQVPSTAVSWRLNGDHAYCNQFTGEAKVLLYQLKNRMSLGGLQSLQTIRRYNDGTVIIAKSFFGQDIIEITAGRGFPSCSITLFDLPIAIQPMRYPGIIGEGKICNYDPWYINAGRYVPLEVEGKDYIKTYYSIGRADCDGCSADAWTVCDTTKLMTDIGFATGGTLCTPFTFENSELPDLSSPPHDIYPNYPGDALYPNGDELLKSGIVPNSHCIWSMWDHCQAEIIQLGSDENGAYFLWKAYTEWSNLGPYSVTFSRTGLGYMLLKALINGPEGAELCSAQSVIKVDCCEKDEIERGIDIYWESLEGLTCTWAPFQFIGSMKVCETPAGITLSTLLQLYISYYVGFFLFPETFGGCVPFTWTLEGPGTLMVYEPFGETVEWFPDQDWLDNNWKYGCTPITFTVTDRCGRTNRIYADCCTAADALSIGYTSIVMACSGTQTLTAGGGCPPYTWSTTNGTITPAANTLTAELEAPATNANCESNPTVTLTDCCGNSENLTFVVQCYALGTVAIRECTQTCSDCLQYGQGWCTFDPTWNCMSSCTFIRNDYDCGNNVIFNSEGTDTNLSCIEPAQCGADCVLTNCLVAGKIDCTGQACNTLRDMRTAAMKTGGCCPLNPWTGEPY